MNLSEARELLATDPRRIDALVAEKVMGFERFRYESPDAHGATYSGEVLLPPGREWDQIIADYSPKIGPIPLGYWVKARYTSSWDAMQEVIERITQRSGCPGFEIIFWRPDEKPWLAAAKFGAKNYPDDDWGEAEADTAPEAVALAALLAVGAIEP